MRGELAGLNTLATDGLALSRRRSKVSGHDHPPTTHPVAITLCEKIEKRRRSLDAILLRRHVVAVSLPVRALRSHEEEGLLPGRTWMVMPVFIILSFEYQGQGPDGSRLTLLFVIIAFLLVCILSASARTGLKAANSLYLSTGSEASTDRCCGVHPFDSSPSISNRHARRTCQDRTAWEIRHSQGTSHCVLLDHRGLRVRYRTPSRLRHRRRDIHTIVGVLS